MSKNLQKSADFLGFELEFSVFSRAVSSTVPVTAVPGTIQVLLYLTKDLVLLARYFVPCTDPRYKVQSTWSKVPGTFSDTKVPVLYLVPQLQVLYLTQLWFFHSVFKKDQENLSSCSQESPLGDSIGFSIQQFLLK